jgi:predicted metal-dependent phosphoesterase TrpH
MVPHDLNVDLHMHSSASDGVLTPSALVARAAANGLQVMALTDHDTLDGLQEATEAAADHGIRFFQGVEISVTWAGETLHLVGLGFDADASALRDALREMQRSRHRRAEEMDKALVAAGLPSVLESALSFAGNPMLVGRTHFARALVAQGVCQEIQEVFDRYLTPNKPGYVPHEWARLSHAMSWIREAGGTPVLAHPARYRLTDTARWALLQEFVSLGGRAIEVSTGSHTQDDTRRYQQIALQWGMQASRGSDFHSPTESRCDVGCAPPLPDGCDPVWANW